MKLFYIFIALLAAVYGTLFMLSFRGFGYAGYGMKRDSNGQYSYHRRPSIFYLGGPSYYGNSGGRSLRSGSRAGPGSFGSGPSLGK